MFVTKWSNDSTKYCTCGLLRDLREPQSSRFVNAGSITDASIFSIASSSFPFDASRTPKFISFETFDCVIAFAFDARRK
jgi:hypothetical protein